MTTSQLIDRTLAIIRSCRTEEQLNSAWNFAKLSSSQLGKLYYRTHMDSTECMFYEADWKSHFKKCIDTLRKEIHVETGN